MDVLDVIGPLGIPNVVNRVFQDRKMEALKAKRWSQPGEEPPELQKLHEQQEKAEQEQKAQAKNKQDDFNALANDDNTKQQFLNSKQNNSKQNNQDSTIDINNYITPSNVTQDTIQKAQQANTLSPNAQDTINLAQEIQQVTKPEYYRNTGIEYFDKTKDLTLGDIFLAKQMGLNLQRIDMNINMNANVRTRDINKAYENTSILNNATDQLMQGLDVFVDKKLHDLSDNAARALHSVASIVPISTDNAKELALNESRITAAATINSNNPRGITQKEKDQARDMMNSTWVTKKGLLGKIQGNLETARNKKQENINRLQDKDLEVPEYFYIDLDIHDKLIQTLNDGKYDAAKAAKLRELRSKLQKNSQNPQVLNEIVQELHKI